MWVRKSEDEVQEYEAKKARKRKSLRWPLIIAFVGTAAGVLLYTNGFRGSFGGFLFFTTSPIVSGVKLLIMGVGLFFIFFSISLYNQRRHGRLTPVEESMLYRDCREPDHFNPALRCQCGGKLEPFDYFDWVSDAD